MGLEPNILKENSLVPWMQIYGSCQDQQCTEFCLNKKYIIAVIFQKDTIAMGIK